MAERSRFWGGTTVGDATEAPYNAETEFAAVLRSVAGAGAIPTDLSGVFNDELNELAVSGTTSPVSVATGRALVYGTWYENDAATTVAVPTPGASTRIDRIVLRKDWTAQTVRITRIAGVEGGAAPSLVQIAGTTWDQPLAQASINTGGVITLTDQRMFIPNPGVVAKRKTADQTVTNSTAVVSDNKFTFPVDPNKTYTILMAMKVSMLTASAFKYTFTHSVSGGTWGGRTSAYSTQAIIAQESQAEGTASGTTRSISINVNGVTHLLIYATFVNGANAGTVTFQWAQATAVAENTTISAGSLMNVTRED